MLPLLVQSYGLFHSCGFLGKSGCTCGLNFFLVGVDVSVNPNLIIIESRTHRILLISNEINDFSFFCIHYSRILRALPKFERHW